MTEECAVAYAAVRKRVSELVVSLDPALLDQTAPATPEWSVRDVVAHMAGVADDIVSGRRDGIASDAWTAAQVERRRNLSVAELLADWDRFGPEFEALLGAGPMEIVGQAVFDAVTHEQDVRGALDRPGARESDAVVVAWEWAVAIRTIGGSQAIRFVTEDGEVVSGAGEPVLTVRAPRFELVRPMTGRRTAAEIAAYDWDPAPEPDVLCAGPLFTIRSESLRE